MLYATLISDMALCVNFWPVAPIASARPSEYARAGSWQLAQLYFPVEDNWGSKNKRPPSATFALDMRLSAGTAGVGKPRGRCHSYPEGSAANAAPKIDSNSPGALFQARAGKHLIPAG